MKKFFTLLLAAMFALSLVACQAKDEPSSSQTEPSSQTEEQTDTPEDEPVLNMPNPVVEYEDLASINEAVGCKLLHPPVMGVSDETFSVIGGTLAEYTLDINGKVYTFRACATEDDITGIYVEDGTVSDELDTVEDGTVISCGGYDAVRWFDGDMQYVITIADRDGEMVEALQSFADEAHSLQNVK